MGLCDEVCREVINSEIIMLRFIFIIMAFLNFFKINGQDKKPVYSVIQAKDNKGELTAIGNVDASLKNYNDKKKYPWCLTISIALEERNLNKNHLPNQQESDIANKFEDVLVGHVEKLVPSKYVGHLYNDGFLDVFIYLKDPEKAHNYLLTFADKKDKIREFAHKIEQDLNWERVESLLK